VRDGELYLQCMQGLASQNPHGTPGSTPTVVINGGSAHLQGIFRGSATNPVISISGGLLYLRDSTLLAAPGNPCIQAGGPAIVGILGNVVANNTNSSAIAFSPAGAFTVDPALQFPAKKP